MANIVWEMGGPYSCPLKTQSEYSLGHQSYTGVCLVQQIEIYFPLILFFIEIVNCLKLKKNSLKILEMLERNLKTTFYYPK